MKQNVVAVCDRTQMCGGGTSYEVYFRVEDKPSRPLHGGHIYATEVLSGDGGPFYRTVDAIDPKSHWAMEQGMEKYDQFKRLEAVADRLNVRIAKRVYPELRGLRKLPVLWASWTLPTERQYVPVRMSLPE